MSGALIGLDARMASPVPSGLGTYAIELTRALTRLDAVNSFVIIRQRDAPPLATASNVREAVIDGDIDAPVNLMRGPAIRRLGLDVYHSLHHFLPIGLRGPRVVLTLHDLIWIEHRRLIRSGGIAPISRVATQAFARAAMRFALNRADRVVAISAHTASRATARFALDPSRVDVIPHGVDHAMFSPAAVDVAPEGGPYFLCLGNSKPYKNIQMALRAFALCAGAARPGGAGDEVRLTITGRGDSTRELQRLARRLNIDRRVVFTGPLPHADVVRLLHGARALIFPSIVEGFGFPVIEAMAAGCPVIASRAPAVAEIAGDAALSCDAGDAEAFAAAMWRMLCEPDLRTALREAGISRASAFTWTATASKTLAVYERLLAERR